MNTSFKLFVIIFTCLFLSGVQVNHKQAFALTDPESTQQRNSFLGEHDPQKHEAGLQRDTISQKKQNKIDLNVSDMFLEKLDGDEKNLPVDLPPAVEKEIDQQRKIKISGEILLDTDEKELVDKVEGGKVNISIPLN